jgi:hypothetical protein
VSVQRIAISLSQLCELLAVDPARFVGIEPDRGGRGAEQRDRTKWWIVVEPKDVTDERHVPGVEQDQAPATEEGRA